MQNDPHPGERQFRLLADNAPVMIWRADTTRACDFFNRPWLEFTGRTAEQEQGFGWTEGLHPDDHDRCLAIYTSAFDARQEFSMDYRLRRHDGVYRWLRDHGRPYFGDDGAFAGYFGSCIDISDMKQAIEDREVLLREVQHRVRNNMQLILSLLDLQGGGIDEPAAKASLRQASGRVRSVALAQERLHESDGFARVDLGDYLRSLVEAAGPVDGHSMVNLSFEADPIDLPLDRAVPTGLVVNELLSNALRHAFPADRPGTVRVEARRGPAGIAITVADDGIGLPETVSFDRPRSLGMQLIKRLSRQVGAELRVHRQGGTRVELALAPE